MERLIMNCTVNVVILEKNKLFYKIYQALYIEVLFVNQLILSNIVK